MASKTFTATILADDNTTMTGFEVPFDPKPVFGKVRAPVVVEIGKHSYRSTISPMGGCWMIPLRKSNRDAAGVKAGERVKVTLTLDDQPRTVTPPKDLVRELKAAKLMDAFSALAYTHQREHVEAIEQAKKPETRERRIKACIAMVRAKAGKAKR
ncbi:MAG: DUF1905 domain-containing protein [Phycisphaeraceae bacterium]|nr:DUF1905 domain-containing protein [Phycisphaeraceae bacterium]